MFTCFCSPWFAGGRRRDVPRFLTGRRPPLLRRIDTALRVRRSSSPHPHRRRSWRRHVPSRRRGARMDAPSSESRASSVPKRMAPPSRSAPVAAPAPTSARMVRGWCLQTCPCASSRRADTRRTLRSSAASIPSRRRGVRTRRRPGHEPRRGGRRCRSSARPWRSPHLPRRRRRAAGASGRVRAPP